MRLPRPFIQLPWQFDPIPLAAEVAALPDSAWMAHPAGLPGNSAVALISRDGGDNNDFAGRMAPTAHLQGCPQLGSILRFTDEVLARSRLMRLAPGAEVPPHVDFNYHWRHRVRMHIPLVTDPAVSFFCGGERIHMAAGECWLFDNWRRHRVTNGSPTDRVHLVLDLAGSSRFWRTVRESVQAAAQNNLQIEQVDLDSVPGREIVCEQHGLQEVMPPGELEALLGEIVQDFAARRENDPQRVAEYQLLLSDFAHDWRCLWNQFGDAPAGHARYAQLLEEVDAGLGREPRAVLMSSNSLGARPVIVQRVLRAALVPRSDADVLPDPFARGSD